jgi:hypothetical protein
VGRLASPTVLRTFGGANVVVATVAWRPTTEWMGLSIWPARCYVRKTRFEESSVPVVS